MVIIRSGSADQLPEHQKKYANAYLECPINLDEFKSRAELAGDTLSTAPGSFAGGICMLIGFSAMDPNTKCTGTVLDMRREAMEKGTP